MTSQLIHRTREGLRNIMNRTILTTIMLLVLLVLAGCSGNSSGNDPVTPSESGDETSVITAQNSIPNSHTLGGFWDFYFDPESVELEISRLRNTQFHVNIVGQLQAPKPFGLSILVHGWDPVNAILDVDLTIHHPYPYTNYRGFDVKGIFMGAGYTVPGKLDPSAVYPAPGSFRVVNADGYTRWWNALEFTTPGFFGFTEGAIGFPGYVAETTVNGYKYFADVLDPGDPVVPKVNISNRGTFSTHLAPPSVTRNYQLQFPKPYGEIDFHFQYAMDLNWYPPNGMNPIPEPIEDFPIEANCPEAFHIEVSTEGTTAYYDNGASGGDVVLAIEVFDWSADSNPGGIAAEIGSIWVESPSLFNQPVSVDLDPLPGSQPLSGIFGVTIPDVNPSGLDGQEVLIIVRSVDPTTYAPPGIADYPEGASLAAYKIVEIPVSNIGPQDAYIIVDIPDGGEQWEPGNIETITWHNIGDPGPTVKIDYTISDSETYSVTPSTPNDGGFDWTIPDNESDEVRIVVTSLQDPLIKDQSNDFFSITSEPVGTITIISPNGGEVWLPGDAKYITWESEGNTGYEVRLNYTVGPSFPVIIIDSTDNDESYLWVPLPDIDSEEVKVHIASIQEPSVTDSSDDYFTITDNPDPKITVTSPNGGETWNCGGAGTITWDSVGLVGYEVRIDYTINNGAPQNIVAQTNNDGVYIWNPIDDIDSEKVKILVSSFLNPSVKDESDGFFTISCGSTETGWNPITDLTLVPFTGPVPNQFEQPPDLAVFSNGSVNQSRGQIVDQALEDQIFFKYNDSYDDVTGTAWGYPSDIGPIHKFDALPGGGRIFVTSAETAPWYPPIINDPTYSVFSTHNNTTGAGEFFLIGDSGEPEDPDNERWYQAVDWSCGVPGGISDTKGYLLMVNSPLWTKTPHDGNIVVLYWDTPYDETSMDGFWINASTQGGGTGEVNDTNPYLMAIAADDHSHVTVDEVNELPALWVLDSTGTATCFVCIWDTVDVITMNPQFDSSVWGAYGRPVDIEIANARDFGYQYSETSDFNWLCALLDNGDGTWSVGVWEYDFLWSPNLAEWNLVDVTDPLTGVPLSIDIDPVDFEIHVLSNNTGTIEATVFDYTHE